MWLLTDASRASSSRTAAAPVVSVVTRPVYRLATARRATSGRHVLLSCRDRAPGRDPFVGGAERLPARAGGQSGAGPRAAAHLVRPARPPPARPPPPRRRRPRPRLARSDRGDRRLGPALACRPRRRARRTRRPSLVRPGSLDHHVPVARRG